MIKNELIETLNVCPSCTSKKIIIYLLEDKYPIEQCNSCKLLFVNPRPSEQSIKNFFSNEYIQDNKRIEIDFVSYRKESLAREATIVKKYLPDGGKLLDLGTASGVFLENFSKCKEWDVSGIEPSIFSANMARKRTSAAIYTGFIDEQNFNDESFDVITSLDTFYFHSYPNKDLNHITRILKPGGLFVIEIPGLNFRLIKNTGLLSKIIYRKKSRLNAGVHLFYYNRRTLSALMKRHDLTLISSYAESSPNYGNGFVRLLNKSYYLFSKIIYLLTNCKVNFIPKEVFVYKKVFS